MRREEKRKEKTKKEKNNGSEESGKGMGNLEWRRRTSKIRGKDKIASTRKVLQVDLHFWQESQWKDAYKETMESCYWYERRVCTEEGEGIPIVKEGEGRGAQVYFRAIEERVY